MAQITIYLPDEVERDIRRQAKSARTSISAYITKLASRATHPKTWSASFTDLYGSAKDLKEPADSPPEPIDS